ncbi:MAG: TetR/AcrR family transcriptional regulator [Pseudomonadales bacterium]
MPQSLSLRRAPTQARARKTFDSLLVAAAGLLQEVGFEAFTTNLLAARSGIGIRAIYRYFPNKHALVCELARQMADRWHAGLAANTSLAEAPWPEVWDRYLDAYVHAVRETPGGIAVLHAMRAHPELRDVDDDINAVYIAEVAQALRRERPTLTRMQARLAATVLLKSTVAIIDAAFDESTANAKRMLAMLKSMHTTLLGQVLAG